MSNSAAQNPTNKVGRNSGAGPEGVTRAVPTPQEAGRGMEPVEVRSSGWTGRLGMGIGAVALVGGGVAAWARQRAQQRRGLRARLQRLMPWK